MKKQWFALLLSVALYGVAYAQTAEAQPQQPQAVTNAPAETKPAFVTTVGYTYVKDNVTYASPLALFEVQGVDTQSGLDRIFVSVDNGEFSPYKGPVSFVTEGAHSLAYRFVDKVSNVSESQVMNIFVDATAPRLLEPVYSPAPYFASGRSYIGLKNQISFKYFDDVTGVAFIEYSAGGNTLMHYAAPFTPEDLALTNSGPFVLNYQATDMVSNVTPLKKTTLYLDAVAPTVNIFAKVYEVNGVKYLSPKDVIQVEAFDTETKVKEIKYAINEGAFTNYDPAIGIHIVTPGEYDIKAVATDVVGNVSAETIYSVVVDGMAPTGEAAYAGTLNISAAPVVENAAVTNTNTNTNAAAPAAAPAAGANASQEVPAGNTAPVTQ